MECRVWCMGGGERDLVPGLRNGGGDEGLVFWWEGGCCWILSGGGEREFAVCGREREVRWEGRRERGLYCGTDSVCFGEVRFGDGVVRVRRGAG